MDDAWGWGLLFAVACLISGWAFAIAPTREERSAALTYALLGAIPLMAWTIAWANMSDLTPGWRRAISAVVGAVVGAITLLCITEVWHKPADAQKGPSQMTQAGSALPSPSTVTNQTNQNGQNIGTQNNYYGSTPQQPVTPTDPSATDLQHIYQAGIVVGKVFGGRPTPNDATTYEFVEITNCSQFNPQKPFYFNGRELQFVSNKSRIGLDISRAQDGMVLGGVVATVIK